MDITTAMIALGLAAAFIFGLAKTGFPGISILGIVLLAIAMADETRQVAGVSLPMLLIGDFMAVRYYQQHTDWATLRKLLLPVTVGMLAGISLMNYVDNQQFEVILGTLILALIILDMARKWFGWTKIPHSPWFAITMGVLAGFATYIGNAAGPVMAIYLLAIGMSKEKFMGCSAWFFMIVNLTKIPFFSLQQMITLDTLQYTLCIVPGMIVGAMLGRPLLKYMPEKVFGPFILFLAALGALKLVGALGF